MRKKFRFSSWDVVWRSFLSLHIANSHSWVMKFIQGLILSSFTQLLNILNLLSRQNIHYICTNFCTLTLFFFLACPQTDTDQLYDSVGWLGAWDNLSLHFDLVSGNSPKWFMQFTFSWNLCICEMSCCIVSWLTLNFFAQRIHQGFEFPIPYRFS